MLYSYLEGDDCVKEKKDTTNFKKEGRHDPVTNWVSTKTIAFLGWLRNRFHWKLRQEKLMELQKIYVGENEEQIFYRYYGKYVKGFLALTVIGMFLCLALLTTQKSSLLKDNYYIEKDGELGKDKTVSVKVDNKTEEKEIKIKVPHRQYSDKEKEVAFEKAEAYVRNHYLGENSSAERITSSLCLVQKIPDSAIQIKWDVGVNGLVNESGELQNESIENPEQIQISAILSYGKDEQKLAFLLTILPKKKSESDVFWKAWENALSENVEKTKSDFFLRLPEQVLGQKMVYHDLNSHDVSYVLGALVLCVIVLPILIDSRLKEKIKSREEQLRMDYPDFVEQFVLLIGAGLTVKGAWERIVKEYDSQNKEMHYVYEEMKVSLREMENGMSEKMAYEVFGKRIGQLSYRKFCTLMEQNLKKGSGDLLHILEFEMQDAFEERKENARMLGEKAGTKLLLPMGMMLIIVFVLIMYAAFAQM